MSTGLRERGEKDLFGEFQTADKNIRKKTGSLLPRLKNNFRLSYENAIFILIGIIMSCVIFFSLGVEKGRKEDGRIEKGDKVAATREKRTGALQSLDLQPIEGLVKKQVTQGVYAIQLAAFMKLESAEDEAVKLKREGYDASIKKSGIYYQLFIGGFEERRQAEQVIKKLKEKYNDCYIKRIGG